jgi:hypothetical protein
MRRTVCWVLMLALVTGGCTRYYRVTDPASGREYYAKKIGRTRTGAVRFRDLCDNSDVTLQSSEVKQIEKTALPEEAVK